MSPQLPKECCDAAGIAPVSGDAVQFPPGGSDSNGGNSMEQSSAIMAEAWTQAPADGGGADRWMRALDMVGAGCALLFFAPILVLIVAAMLVGDRGPVLFRHRRIGRDGRPFYCLKFRTMVPDAEARLKELLARSPEARAAWMRDQKLKNDPRITPVGKFLRVSSLDELPQLWNVLMGEMSLVGPRPITESEIARYGRYFVHYVRVRPGITGLWQISGRNDVSYRRRVAMDVTYARTASFALYLRILVFTVPAVLLARGSG